MDSLDQTDRAIIGLLNEDGRMSSAEISRRLGDVPSRTVSYRIDHLIERGIISVKAIVNPPALGYNVLADVFLEVEPGRVRAVANKVASFPEVSYVACATGESVTMRNSLILLPINFLEFLVCAAHKPTFCPSCSRTLIVGCRLRFFPLN
jgi:Lrp/AsnC family transcriptional regulator for asnA, asnC and gidA